MLFHIERFFAPTKAGPQSLLEPSIGAFPLNNGLLADPDDQAEKILYIHDEILHRWKHLANFECLVMFGEPGRGKSLEWQFQATQINSRATIHKAYLINGRDIDSAATFTQALSSGLEHLQSDPAHTVEFFIDSLDEGMLLFNKLDKSLAEAIRSASFPSHRVKWRISCRPADWPSRLGSALLAHYGEENVCEPRSNKPGPVAEGTQSSDSKVEAPGAERALYYVNLCPFRETDVRSFVTHYGISDSTQFIEELDRVDARPLASDPISLRAMLVRFLRSGRLPHSKTELYNEMMDDLLKEWSKERLQSVQFDNGMVRARANISIADRRAIAERLATLIVFGNKYAIQKEGIPPDSESVIGTADVIGQYIAICQANPPIQISCDALAATLDTPLFTNIAGELFIFGHRSYAEFLAAWAILDWPLSRIKWFLSHASDSQHIVRPQLRETAAWIAGMNAQYRDWLLEAQPDVLVMADSASLDQGLRAQLTDRLFNYLGQSGTELRGIHASQMAQRLDHPSLAKKLVPYLTGSGTYMQHAEAVGIAVWIKFDRKSSIALANAALDDSKAIDIRVYAMEVLRKSCMDEDVCRRLEPLASLSSISLNSNRLKGAAVKLLFPKFWKIDELVSVMEIPGSLGGNVTGPNFTEFFRYRLASLIDDSHVLPLGNWLLRTMLKLGHKASHKEFGRLAAQLVLRAALRIHEPEYAELTGRLINSFTRNHCKVWYSTSFDLIKEVNPFTRFEKEVLDDSEKRQTLLRAILFTLPNAIGHDEPISSTGHRIEPREALNVFIPKEEDFEYLARITSRCKRSGRALAYCWLHKLLIDYPSTDKLQQFIDVIREDVDLRARLETDYVYPVPTKSWAWPRQQITKKNRELKAAKARLEWYRIVKFLGPIQNGSFHSLVKLFTALSSYPVERGTKNSNEFFAENTALIEMAEDTKLAIFDAIEKRFLHRKPHGNGLESYWTNSDSLSSAAFRWVIEHRPNPQSWDQTIWTTWLPATLDCFELSQHQESWCDRILTSQSSEICSWVRTATEHDLRGQIIAGEKPVPAFRRRFCSRLLAQHHDVLIPIALNCLLNHRLSTSAEQWCLELLADCSNVALEKWLQDNIFAGVLTDSGHSEFHRHVLRIQALMGINPSAAWRVVEKPFLYVNDCLVKVARALGVQFEFPQELVDSMTLQQMETALIQLTKLYSLELTAHPGGRSNQVWKLYHMICGRAKGIGSFEAVQMFQRLVQSGPPVGKFFEFAAREAEWNWLSKSWERRPISDLHQLLNQRKARTVRSSQELFELILEMLNQIQTVLRGESSALTLLWKEEPKSKKQNSSTRILRPHREDKLQAFIINQLNLLLTSWPMIGHREVKVGEHGHSDVLVTAVTQRNEVLNLIIETKIQDHPDVKTAMTTQLVNGYMNDPQIRHGIYLVAWYVCEAWTPKHYKLGKTIEDAERLLLQQASALKQKDLNRLGDVAPFVLDCRLPKPASLKNGNKTVSPNKRKKHVKAQANKV